MKLFDDFEQAWSVLGKNAKATGWQLSTASDADILRKIAPLNGKGFDFGEDNEGQIVIYTGLYEHSDGSVHDSPEGDQKKQ